jgi:hypothetical protein
MRNRNGIAGEALLGIGLRLFVEALHGVAERLAAGVAPERGPRLGAATRSAGQIEHAAVSTMTREQSRP